MVWGTQGEYAMFQRETAERKQGMSTQGRAQFTPGPWVVNTFIVNGQHKLEVLDATGANACVQANAHLIAAAPAMYLALQNIVEGLTDEITRIIEGNEPDTAWLDYLANKAGQALSQAEGRHHE